MKPKNFIPLAYVFSIAISLFWGCQGNQPVTPSRAADVSVYVPQTAEVKAALLNAAQNEILYRVDGPGMSSIRGSVGPFSTAGASGSFDFTVDVPTGPSRVLSVQLNDASTHQPLALGAAGFDLTGAGSSRDIVVDMGSVTRTCYYVNTDNPPTNNPYGGGYNFSFESDATTIGTTDLIIGVCQTCPLNSFSFSSPPTAGPPISNIAYLGKGDLVDFDYVPPASAFFASSDAAKGGGVSLESGDVYCIDLMNPVGGHAWVRVTDPGSIYSFGPAFIYRMNSTLPYYGYERTTADINNGCSSF